MHQRHGRASGGCGSPWLPAIVGSEGRGLCGADGEKLEQKVGHPADEIDWGGR